ncbi:unnamed protein product, partial [Symbiodinium sp. KB8]
MYKAPGYRTDGLRSVSASCFGDHITADHVVIYRDSDNMVEDVRLALVIKDAATSFMFAYPSALKDADECKAALQHFVSSTDKVGVFYSDNAKELTKASKPLGSRHEHSKDYIHQSNACNFRGHTLQSFGSRSFPWYWPQALEHACVFLGYYFQPGMKWKREILVLSLKELNRNDFNECLPPVKANQFSVPEGDFVFPMKDRYERVRAGLAPDALEGPGPPPLENQDAEVGDEQKAEIENASLTVKPTMVIDPVSRKSVPLPEGGRYYAQKRKAIEESAMKAALEKLDDDGTPTSFLWVVKPSLKMKMIGEMYEGGSAKEEQKNKKVHVGKIFEICVEKGSELPEGDPLRKFKGRTVFQGNNVKDENNDTALFSELGSSPATMEAGKTLVGKANLRLLGTTLRKDAQRGPKESMAKGWELIASKIDMVVYDMSSFLQQAIDRYKLAGLATMSGASSGDDSESLPEVPTEVPSDLEALAKKQRLPGEVTDTKKNEKG